MIPQHVAEHLQFCLDEIGRHFKSPKQVTLVVRVPGRPDRGLMMTSESDVESVVDAMRYLRDSGDVHPPDVAPRPPLLEPWEFSFLKCLAGGETHPGSGGAKDGAARRRCQNYGWAVYRGRRRGWEITGAGREVLGRELARQAEVEAGR